jgi:hypothetical protein
MDEKKIDEKKIRKALENAKKQNAIWCKHINSPPVSDDGLIDPIDAKQYFKQCLESVENGLVEMAQRFSPIQWLWYLRRFPYLHTIEVHGFESYSLTLATILSAKSHPTKNAEQFNPQFGFPLNRTTANHVLEFVAGVYGLADLHIKYGIASREVPFRINTKHLPDPVFTKIKKQAGQIFDTRKRGYDLTGTIPSQADLPEKSQIYTIDKAYLPFFSLLPYFELRDLETPGIISSRYTMRSVYLKHISNLYHLTENGNGQWLNKEVFSLLLLAGSLLPIAASAPEHSINIAKYGYSMHKQGDFLMDLMHVFDELKSLIKGLFPDADLPDTPTQLMNDMKTLDTNSHPIIPGVLLSNDTWIVVDHANVKTRLEKMLRFPSLGGEVGNQRGIYFEDAIQSYIDASHWKPSDKLKSMQQVHLIRQSDGTEITDIDAIGESGNTLLIISCKAVISSIGQDIGEYFALKNARIRLDEAVLKWQDVKAELTDSPIGQNYDFSLYSKILAIVCTPSVIYTESELSLSDEVSGIRKAATAIEFLDWLHI